jgi:hypothetical protein
MTDSKLYAPRLVDIKPSPVAITVQVVVAMVIGHHVATCVKDLPRKGERNAGIPGRPQHVVYGRQPLVKRAKHIRRGGLANLFFAVLEGRDASIEIW